MSALVDHYISISKSLLRVPTYLLLCLYLLVGLLGGIYQQVDGVSSLHFLPTLIKFLCCMVVIAFWYMNGTALNDYADYEIDLINLKNDKERPLIAGLTSKTELANLATVYAICTVSLALLVSSWHALLVGVLILLNHAYSIKPLQLSRRGGIAPLLLPLGYVALPYLLGIGITGWTLSDISISLLIALYLQFIGRIILKDYRDVKGDAAHNKITFLLKYGNTAVCIVSGITISASALIILRVLSTGVLKYPLILLTSYAGTMLFNLSSNNKWVKQKPLLAAFGRSMTGVTVTLIAALMALIWRFSFAEVVIVASTITLVYIWSAQQAFIYNTRQLARKKA